MPKENYELISNVIEAYLKFINQTKIYIISLYGQRDMNND